MKIEHLLVATDLSEAALVCTAPVGNLARSLGARMTLLHVISGYDAIPHGAPLAPPLEEPAPPGTEEAALTRVRERTRAFGEGIEITPVVITGGDPAVEIVEYAEVHGADMIVVSTHGRSGFRNLVLGSVAEGVTRRSKVPVLVVPRPKSKSKKS